MFHSMLNTFERALHEGWLVEAAGNGCQERLVALNALPCGLDFRSMVLEQALVLC